MTAKRYGRWRDPFKLGKPALINQLAAYQHSHAMPTEVRDTIGAVLARVEIVRVDDLAVLLQLARDVSYQRASIEDVSQAAKVAFWFSNLDAGKRSA